MAQVEEAFWSGFHDCRWLYRTSTVRRVLSLAAVVLFSSSALHGQTEYGLYAPGAAGPMKMAILPPPGLVIENGVLTFFSRDFVAGSGQSTKSDINVVANRTMFVWNSEKKLMGARYQAAIVFPLANFAGPRPTPGNDTSVGIGDIVLQPVGLGWRRGNFDFLTSYTVFTPTGRFTFGASDNRGRGMWSHMLSTGVTWQSGNQRPWDVSVQGRYEFLTQIRGSDIKPGSPFHLEWAVGKKVSQSVDVGVVGAGSWQVTDIQGSDFTGDPTKYHFFSIGPEIQWHAVQRNDWNMFIQVRSYFDVSVLNAAQGAFLVVSFAFLL